MMAGITPTIGFGGFNKIPFTSPIVSPLAFSPVISPFSLGFGGIGTISPLTFGKSPFGFGFRGFNPLGFGNFSL